MLDGFTRIIKIVILLLKTKIVLTCMVVGDRLQLRRLQNHWDVEIFTKLISNERVTYKFLFFHPGYDNQRIDKEVKCIFNYQLLLTGIRILCKLHF
jgi:hypothetical protein